jgi:hypothetical protein
MVLKSVSIITFGGLAGGFAKQLKLPIKEKNPQTPIRSSRIALGELHFWLVVQLALLVCCAVERLPPWETNPVYITQAAITQVDYWDYGDNNPTSRTFRYDYGMR